MATNPGGGSAAVRPEQSSNGRRGLFDLARLAVEDVIRLVQQEIQLAKLEIKEMLRRNLLAASLLAAAGLFLLLFLVLALVTLAFVLPDHAFVAGIEATVFLVLAVTLALVGAKLLRIGPPPKTMTSLKEDAEWARQLLKRNGK